MDAHGEAGEVLFSEKTTTVDDDDSPHWGQTFVTPVVNLNCARLHLTVWDNSDVLGRCMVDLSSVAAHLPLKAATVPLGGWRQVQADDGERTKDEVQV